MSERPVIAKNPRESLQLRLKAKQQSLSWYDGLIASPHSIAQARPHYRQRRAEIQSQIEDLQHELKP